MLRRIRELMATPFARPPGRRSVWARFAPEWCALAVCAGCALAQLLSLSCPLPTVLLGLAPPKIRWLGLQDTAVLCAGLFGLFMPLAVAVAAARSFSVERERGTLEALLLTLVPRNLLARKRFWSVVAPWMRLACYSLLACLAVNLTGIQASRSEAMLDGSIYSYGAAPWSIRWLDFLGKVFVTHSWDASVSVWRMETLPAGSIHGFLLSGMRWANDVSSFLFAAALAFFLSMRVKSTARAVTLSLLAAAGALLTLVFDSFAGGEFWKSLLIKG